MSFALPSLLPGAGAAILAGTIDFLRLSDFVGSVPKVLDAAVFGVSVSLADRVIDYAARDEFEGKTYTKMQTIPLTTVIIALKILSPYVLQAPVQKMVGRKIPLSFIHIQTALYIAALCDGEFENTAKTCFPNAWREHKDRRKAAIFMEQKMALVQRLFQ